MPLLLSIDDVFISMLCPLLIGIAWRDWSPMLASWTPEDEIIMRAVLRLLEPRLLLSMDCLGKDSCEMRSDYSCKIFFVDFLFLT